MGPLAFSYTIYQVRLLLADLAASHAEAVSVDPILIDRTVVISCTKRDSFLGEMGDSFSAASCREAMLAAA